MARWAVDAPPGVTAMEPQLHAAARTAELPDLSLTDGDDLDRIEGIWRELWARTEPVPPMLQFDWIRQWWRLHRDEGRLFVLLIFDDRRQPLGLAPLYLRDEGLSHPERCLRTVGFLGTGEAEGDEVTGEYTTWLGPPAAMPIVTRGLLARLADTRGAWDRLRLDCLWPEADIHGALLRALGADAAHAEISSRPSFRSSVRPLDGYLRALPSANFRHRCRRALREGDEQGLQLVRAGNAAEGAEMFEALVHLHQRRWRRRGEPGAFASSVFSGFQWALLDRHLASGAAWLVGLRQGERWLAVRYLLQAGGRLYDYLSGVDTEASPALAPGLLLHLQTMAAAAAAGVTVYDLMAGEADYKRHLALEVTEVPTLDVFAPTMRARLWLAARNLRRRLASRRAGTQPPVERPPAGPELVHV